MGEPVDVRRAHEPWIGAVAADAPVAEIVGEDDDEVGPLGGGEQRRGGQRRKKDRANEAHGFFRMKIST
jgi:hypothetical protein